MWTLSHLRRHFYDTYLIEEPRSNCVKRKRHCVDNSEESKLGSCSKKMRGKAMLVVTKTWLVNFLNDPIFVSLKYDTIFKYLDFCTIWQSKEQ